LNQTFATITSAVKAFAATLLWAIPAVLSGPALGQSIYTTHDDGLRIGTINPASGAGADVGSSGQVNAWALAFDLDGTIYTTYDGYSGNAQLARASRQTGAITATVGGLGVSLIALEMDVSGQIWGVGYDDGVLYRINKATAAKTAVGSTGLLNLMDLAFDPSGALYATVGNDLYRLNTLTGASTLVASITGIATATEVMGIMFDANGTLFATVFAANSPLYRVNLTTGVATAVGDTGLDYPHGGDIPATPPGAPTCGAPIAGVGTALIAFVAPGSNGGAPITGYTATCVSSDGGVSGTGSGASSPISVSSLTAQKTYSCTVSATNGAGTGPNSSSCSTFLVLAPPVIPTLSAWAIALLAGVVGLLGFVRLRRGWR